MAKKERKVEVVKVTIRTLDHNNLVSFSEVLLSDLFKSNKKYINGRQIELEIISNTVEYLTGIVITIQDKDVPPKRHKKTGEFSSLDVKPDEGLSYANIFLYEKRRGILIYEINRNGCFLDNFKEYLYVCRRENNEKLAIDINFSAVLRANEYNRALSMRLYKSIEIKLAFPYELVQLFNDRNGSMSNNPIFKQINDAVQDNCDVVTIKHSIVQGNKMGLAPSRVREFLNTIHNILLKSDKKRNVELARVVGYSEDVEETRQHPIDLVADVLRGSFRIEEPRIHSDVQMNERNVAIIDLYLKLNCQFDVIFGKND